MTLFRIYLVVAWIALIGYTALVIAEHGAGLAPVFFGDIARMGWPGQFNLDFLIMLTVSALWTAWRNAFSALGLALAFLALVGGASFLLPYLLVLSLRWKGDMRPVVLGPSRA